MEQIIYADVLFIVNFSMDFIALYITSKLIHNQVGIFTLIISSGIGGVYGVISLISSGNPILNALINAAIAFLMCFITFGIPSILILIRNTLTFYGISFLMGGAMTGIFYMTNKGVMGRGVVINGEPASIYSDISPLSIILSALGAVIFSYICSGVMKKIKGVKKARINVKFNGKETSFSGICDTGNLLLDPITSLPCLICSYDAFSPLIPMGLVPLFRDKNVSLLEYTDPTLVKRIRIIPMKGVGSSGILLGIIPDEITLNGVKKELCIACDPKTSSFAETESIIPASVI